ncbi:MAG: hypothetical protein KDG44_01950 [Burkholderiaceae bacterium]|nr:hypothetical protein [Burkholderiaceae bacterium]
MVRKAHTLRKDDDWGQAGTLVRDVIDEAARDRLMSDIVGHLEADVSTPVLARARDYRPWIRQRASPCSERGRAAAPASTASARVNGLRSHLSMRTSTVTGLTSSCFIGAAPASLCMTA